MEIDDVDPRSFFGGGHVVNIRAVVSSASEMPFGVVFDSANGQRTFIYNWGDELRVSRDDIPELDEINELPIK